LVDFASESKQVSAASALSLKAQVLSNTYLTKMSAEVQKALKQEDPQLQARIKEAEDFKTALAERTSKTRGHFERGMEEKGKKEFL
jgi:tetratricopeptide (TPR) repeat protein